MSRQNRSLFFFPPSIYCKRHSKRIQPSHADGRIGRTGHWTAYYTHPAYLAYPAYPWLQATSTEKRPIVTLCSKL